MTTPDANMGGGGPAALDSSVDTFAALPDVKMLTRLANATFAAMPGAGTEAGFVPPIPPAPAAPSASAGSARALPAGVGGLDDPLPSAPHAPQAPESVTRTPSVPSIPLPGEAELRALLAAAAPSRVAALPGFSAGAPGSSFYFLEAPPPISRAGASHPGALPGTPPHVASGPAPFDVNAVRRDFPILAERVHGRPLIWLDNAATTQKPQAVIDRLAYFYRHENSNIHRAAHQLAARATDAYEAARETVRRFVNASSADEIVFVRGATEAINLVAQSWGRKHVGRDDEIIVTWLEHHANIVPWQQLCAEVGARLRVVPVDDRGQVLLDQYERLLSPRTRLVAFAHVSNALGTITPARQMIEMARRYDARVLVDGAQAVSHMRTDVQALGCDFYVFSGHKVFAPTGIGVLYGKREVLDGMPPWQGGGNMIRDVTFEKTEYLPPPGRFEAGTGNIADAAGLAAAIDYVERIGLESIGRWEHELLAYATRLLAQVPGLRLIGTAAEKAAVLSFVIDGFGSEEIGEALDREGIAVRAGHHCAQPILRRFGVESTVRPSLAFYNTVGEIESLAAALHRIRNRSPRID